MVLGGFAVWMLLCVWLVVCWLLVVGRGFVGGWFSDFGCSVGLFVMCLPFGVRVLVWGCGCCDVVGLVVWVALLALDLRLVGLFGGV